MMRRNGTAQREDSIWDLIHEQETQMIKKWRAKRKKNQSGYQFFAVPFDIKTIAIIFHHVNLKKLWPLILRNPI